MSLLLLHVFRKIFVFIFLALLVCIDARAQDYVPGEVIVKFKGRPGSQASVKALSKVSQNYKLKRSFSKINMHQLKLQKSESVTDVVSGLRNDPDVEYAEPNYIFKRFNEDSHEELFNSFSNLDESKKFSREAILNYYSMQSFKQFKGDADVEQGWMSLSTLNQNPDKVIVAIIDSGLDTNHPVFVDSNAVWMNAAEVNGAPGVDDDGNGFIDDLSGWNFINETANVYDDEGHGTHVAGIVLGVGQNIFDYVLEDSKIQIMPLKFLSSTGAGTTADAISAIYYAVDNGARVINNSWGGGSQSKALLDAYNFAYKNKVILVSAAGNSTNNNDTKPVYPSNYDVPSNLSVAATNSFDGLASFSNYGAKTVHIGAPGVSILSTLPNNSYAYMSGTSMAAPFMSGIAALVIRESSQLSGYQVKTILMESADVVEALKGKVLSSSRSNLLNAIIYAQNNSSVLTYQPEAQQQRSPASSGGGGGDTGGCGLVKAASDSGGFNGFIFGLLVSLPIYILITFRNRARARNFKNRRKYDRYVMNSYVKIKVDGRELLGQVNTVSLGGISFDADELLEKGGAIQMHILGPDGTQFVQVEGQIVWSEQDSKYGVQFSEMKDNVKTMIESWSQKLVKC